MAHGVKAATKPRLHQALHGYADGHRQLALSTTLKPRDQRTLLALSDISGPGARLDEAGYLTGYPLTESGFYALARTWPAPEMPRPGCVWTHTLLIDFNDLAALETLTGLLGMFRRPASLDSFQEYDKPTPFAFRSETVLTPFAKSWTRQVMAGLYGKPRSRIVVARLGGEVDGMVLALWSQQWPRLRRSFRFCTFAASDRSADSGSFDLQVLPSSDRSIRARFYDVVDAEAIRPSAGQWLDAAVQDLLQPDVSGLRAFFRQLGADVTIGREAFRPLCRLHHAVANVQKQPEAVHDAISILKDELGPKQARTARAIVAKVALEQVESLDEQSSEFLWKNLDLLDYDTLAGAAARLGRSAWRRDPGILVPFLDKEGALKIILEFTLAELDVADLAAGLAQAPGIRSAALSRRPELVGLPEFWATLDSVDEAFRTAKSSHMEIYAVAALLSARRDDLAPRAVQEFGVRLILQALSTALDRMGDRLGTWLHMVVIDTGAVAEFLVTQPAIPRAMLYELAQLLQPDAVPNDYGADPWLIAHSNAVGAINEDAASYIFAYLLSRALGHQSRSMGELAKFSFESTYVAASKNLLSEKGWRLLELRLPCSVFWLSWDRCQRLRTGVTDLFIDRSLAPDLFGGLVQDDRLFSLLVEEAARSGRGRNYLKSVYHALKTDENIKNADFAERVRSIESVLG
ncbi:hypothetical protein [Azotobacter beijerinckii]|uniref:Uncharacterized protein n=1 Tax=Azotobacter beijerinckii TaxID=170623 RepID=A0A1I1CGA3_9GAMM|nr:hypothetical protein [Azotobacter beijerinckii]SFB61072.1 hypothetical protein SAMN04244571_04260 [Azotobacter beijerinckii]